MTAPPACPPVRALERELSNAPLVEAVARRVVELLREEAGEALPASEIARRFGLSRAWVYAHADDLAAVRIGTGPRPRLRFYPSRVSRYLDACSEGSRSDPPETAAASDTLRRRRSASGQRTDLLPIRGQEPAR